MQSQGTALARNEEAGFSFARRAEEHAGQASFHDTGFQAVGGDFGGGGEGKLQIKRVLLWDFDGEPLFGVLS